MIKFNHQLTKFLFSSVRFEPSKYATTTNAVRYVQTVPDRILEKTRKSKIGKVVKGPSVTGPEEESPQEEEVKYTEAVRDYKYIYPEFLPHTIYYFRDKIRERLERIEMLNRRKQIEIPEFYVGSILAVVVSDPYAPGKENRFVGICTRREGVGLRHSFTLRNTIDGLGVEIAYDLYNPTMKRIEVLKLEKRLDDNLSYLQDCPPEYSTIPFDMEPVKLPPGSKVPLNTIKLKLNPRPWRHRWERKNLKGIILPEIERSRYEEYRHSNNDFKPFEKYDLMKHYRETIHDKDFVEVYKDIKKYEKEQDVKQETISSARKLKRARELPKQSK